jgi:hypothetical protein
MTRLMQLVCEGGDEVRVVGPGGTAKPLLGLLASVQCEENDTEGADREGSPLSAARRSQGSASSARPSLASRNPSPYIAVVFPAWADSRSQCSAS